MIVEGFEMSGNHRLTERVRHTQTEYACRFPMSGGVQQHFLRKMADVLGIAQGIPSRIRQRYRMADPVKERNAQFLFQLFDLKRNGGLGIAKLFTGFCETSLLRYFHKNTQGFDIHSILQGSSFSIF